MPDWSWQTLFRPLFFSLPDRFSRKFVLGFMKGLSGLPAGESFIRWLGQMEPPGELRCRVFGLDLCTPVGFTGEVDEGGMGITPLSLMGAGFLDIGVVTLHPREGEVVRDAKNQCFLADDPWANPGLEKMVQRLKKKKSRAPLIARVGFAPGASPEEALQERIRLIRALSPFVDAFALDALGQGIWPADEWTRHVRILSEECLRQGKPLLAAVSVHDEPMKRRVQEPDSLPGVKGLILTDVRPGVPARIGEKESGPAAAAWLRSVRANLPFPVIASGGIHEPADALRLFDAGSDLVQVNSGFVFAGPGLVKRINEALLHRMAKERKPDVPPAGWLSGMWLGFCLAVIGIVAWQVAAGDVILPYDEVLSGLTREELEKINPRLLAFMAHDRVTLSGTLISLGILYLFLSRFGVARGYAWARKGMIISGAIGFASLFYFLGHGYRDPLHAVLSFGLFPFFVLFVFGTGHARFAQPSRNLCNHAAWKRSLWGQLCFVVLGCSLAIGGLVISVIGMTEVFVPDDLEFLGSSSEKLRKAGEGLLPLIAHDRAGFGGTLLATGVLILWIALSGFKEGERWIWRMLLLGGLPAFVAGIGIHYAVGYVDQLHLLPAYFAGLLYVSGLTLSYSWFHVPPAEKRKRSIDHAA